MTAPTSMPRWLRRFTIGCIAVTFGYLLLHAREPLRTNIGDPWSDANVLSSMHYVHDYGFLETSFTDVLDVGPLTELSYRYTHYPPLAEIIYGSLGKLGISDIGWLRFVAIGFSGLAIWLFYGYVRRLVDDDDIALIAAMLWTTSLVWMMYADSIHQAPIMTASGFLALWGLVHALDDPRLRYRVAIVAGSFACILTSYDYWLFLPAAVIATLWLKRGNPFARGARQFLVLCAAGCIAAVIAKSLAVIGAVGWHEFVGDIRMQFFERSTLATGRGSSPTVPTLVRRFTLVFTPLVWVTIAVNAWRAIRAPSLGDAVRRVWLLLVALAFFQVFAQLAASQMLPAQVMLPFYSIGSAQLIVWLLAGARRRWLGVAWLVVAPLWAFVIMFTIPRVNLDRDDVAKTNELLASHDRNDFVLSNLVSIGHIQAAFDRHYWETMETLDPTAARLKALSIFEQTGASYVHDLVFTNPEARFIDKSLWPYALGRQQWAVTGWPHLYHARTLKFIREIERLEMAALDAVHATKLVEFATWRVYRIDRTTVIEQLSRDLPHVTSIDMSSIESTPFKLLGWSDPVLLSNQIGASTITGFLRCTRPRGTDATAGNACVTYMTNLGLRTKDAVGAPTAQLLIPIDEVCDTELVLEFANPTTIEVSVHDHAEAGDTDGTTARVVIPSTSLHRGANLVEIEDLANVVTPTANLRRVDIHPSCGSARLRAP